jgi:hypothetical protein
VSLFLRAGAGTGKTSVVCARVLYLMSKVRSLCVDADDFIKQAQGDATLLHWQLRQSFI